MGVAGSGKTTLGRLLAGQLGWTFVEGDAFHPPANVEKMHRGEPLTDADRAPWLRALHTRIDDEVELKNIPQQVPGDRLHISAFEIHLHPVALDERCLLQ